MGRIRYSCRGIIKVEHEYKALLRAQERLTNDYEERSSWETQLQNSASSFPSFVRSPMIYKWEFTCVVTLQLQTRLTDLLSSKCSFVKGNFAFSADRVSKSIGRTCWVPRLMAQQIVLSVVETSTCVLKIINSILCTHSIINSSKIVNRDGLAS